MKNNNGFTLVEVLISLVILSMLVVVLSDVYVQGMISSRQEIKKSQLVSAGQVAMEGIIKNVRAAAEISQTHTIYNRDAETLILKIPAIDSNEEFIYYEDELLYDYIVYRKLGRDLHKITFSDNFDSRNFLRNNQDTIILSNVSSLSFNYTPVEKTTLVQVNLSLINDLKGKTETFSVTGEGRIRND